jgi:DNA gyrase subunit A
MATNIPPHNLSEVVDALHLLIDRPAASLPEVMKLLPGPDFPTAGFIHGYDGIRSAYATGRGIIQVRARAEIEEIGDDRQAIVVTEIPYQVNKKKLLEQISHLVREKRVTAISELRDESDRNGIRIVIELKRGELAEVVLNALYKLTPMQVTFGIILLAIVDNQPRVLGLLDILRHFLDHRKTVVIRRTRHDLRKAEERAHVLEGILKALDRLDEVIATIRASRTPAEARERLEAGFALSEVQAQAILDMRLQRLTGLEREKVVEEYREIAALIERLRAILASDALVLAEIRRELGELKQAFGDRRRTEIIAETQELTVEDLIADEDMVITVTHAGYIKRSPLALYRAQHRGGKGRTGMLTKDGDFVEHLYVASAHSYVLVFTESGRVYWIKVHQIPEGGPAAKGKAIVNLLDLEATEKVATTVAVREFPEDRYLVFATERGTVKKTSLAAFARPLARGILAIGIDEGDRLLAVKVVERGQELLLATAKGHAIRFPEWDPDDPNRGVRPMGRPAYGVRGIKLRAGDRVVGIEVLAGAGHLLTVTERGYGKRTPLDDYRAQARGGLGIINLKAGAKTGEVIAVKQVDEGDGLLLITVGGKILRTPVDTIRVVGRATQGVKVMELADDDGVAAAARLPAREEGELDELEGLDGGEEGGFETGDLEAGDFEAEDVESAETGEDGESGEAGEDAEAGGEPAGEPEEPVN